MRHIYERYVAGSYLEIFQQKWEQLFSALDKALCPLFICVGGEHGTSMCIDNNHLGKRFRGRLKSSLGSTIGPIIFTKVDLVLLVVQTKIINSPDKADQLFNPENLMGALETVKCLHTIGCFAAMSVYSFPEAWRKDVSNRPTIRALRLLGHVLKLMSTLIIGHKGNLDDNGDHFFCEWVFGSVCYSSAFTILSFRKHTTNFIPVQHYRNCQDTIKNYFIAVTVA